MFRLHGSAMSNFYNMVKLVLLEKGLDFEEVGQPPAQTEEFLAISPMGKIPVLQVREGYLTETGVILDFLEDVYPEIPLYPRDPFARALTRRICHMSEIYIDMAMRPLMAAVMTDTPLEELAKAEVKARLEKGLAGLARVAKPDPWLCGKDFTVADVVTYYCLDLSANLAKAHLGVDVYGALPGFPQWREAMASRDLVAEVDEAQRRAREKFFQSLKKG